MKKIYSWLIVLACIGIGLSGYAFLHNRGFAPGSFCTINSVINCDIVNKGPFSMFFGVPVALLGLIGYAFLLVGVLVKRKNPEDRLLSLFLLGLSYMGFGFSLYLSSIEATVLHAWCIICIFSQIAMFLFAILATVVVYREEHFHPFLSWVKGVFKRA